MVAHLGCGAPGEQKKADSTPTGGPRKLETGFRTISAGVPHTLLLRIEAIGLPTFGLLLQYRLRRLKT